MGAKRGNGSSKKTGGRYRNFCGFHRKPSNRNRFHPTQTKLLNAGGETKNEKE
jgi:hypothetical protein